MGFSEYVAKYCDHEIVVIVAATNQAGKVQPEQHVCVQGVANSSLLQ